MRIGTSVNMKMPEIAKATKLTITASVSPDMNDVDAVGPASEKSKVVPSIAV